MIGLKMMWIRIAALFRRNRLERDMDKEFRFHLDMRTEENIRVGMPEKEARETALRRFGSVALAKEHARDVRGSGLLEPLAQDVRYGLRTLRHSPGFTIVAILALSIGIGANTAVFSYMDAMFWRPLPMPNSDRLVRFYGAGERNFDTFSYANYADVRDRAKSFSHLAAHQSATVNLTMGQEPEKAEAELVTGNYFDVVGIRPQLGRLLLREDDSAPGAGPVAVISDTLWKVRYGSDPQIVGTRIGINGHPFTIVGVAPASFRGTFPAFKTDLWVPIMMYQQVRPTGIAITNRGWGWLHGTGRLAPGVSREQAQAEVAAIAEQIRIEYPRFADGKFNFEVVPAGAMREQFVEPASRILLFLMLAATAVLIITCGNVASVLLARAMSRRGEIAVRQSLGASRGRLVRQWITESVLLAAFGGAAGLVFAMWLCRAALSLTPADFASFSPDFRLDLRTSLFALASAVMSGVIFGFIPAIWIRRSDVATTLKYEGGSAGAKVHRSRLYSVLVTVQIALSVVLLITAGLLFRSLRESDIFNPGFDTRNLLVADIDLRRSGYTPAAQAAFYPRLIERIRALPGVRALTYGAVVPLGMNYESAGVFIAGHQNPNGRPYFSIANNIVGPDYFKTMGIPLVSGRAFNPDEFRRDARPVTIVGEAMARQFWPGENPVGKTVRFAAQGPEVEIVGVAQDIKYYDVREAPRPYIYRPAGQANSPWVILILRTDSDPDRVIPLLKTELAAVNPNLTWEHAMSFRELRREALMPERAMLITSIAFGAIALVITAIGLYGVISYSVNRRTSEIGVRMALGASRASILNMVIRDGLRLTAIGCLGGLLIAFGVTRFMSSQLFGITPTDPATFTTTVILMFVVAFVACYIPARRATRIAPTAALKWGA